MSRDPKIPLSDKPEAPFAVWMDITGTSERQGSRMYWGNWGNTPEPYNHGPYIHLDQFMEMVNWRAEQKMLKTGKLEGSHYAAMQEISEEIKGCKS